MVLFRTTWHASKFRDGGKTASMPLLKSLRELSSRRSSETIENGFTLCFGEQKESIKTSKINMVEGSSVNIVEQSCLDAILVCKVHMLAKSSCFMHALT